MGTRREFLRKAWIVGSLSTAGAVTLKRDYVKPVVQLLEPGRVCAQTPSLTVSAASWSMPAMDIAVMPSPVSNTLTLTVDLPGGSAPIPGSTFNAFLSITPLADGGSGWTAVANIPIGMTVNTDTVDNIGSAGPGGVVQFEFNPFAVPPLLNGFAITPSSPAPGNFAMGVLALIVGGAGDRASICCIVDADAGSTVSGTAYPAQALGSWCFELFRS